MKRAAILTILAMLAVAAACGDPSFPPQACGVLQDTEVFIGEQQAVALCFQDPDGDAVTATATASDPSVVEAVVQGGAQGVLLTGRDAGEAVITVVAQDSKGLSAPPQTFTVTVPNRAPEAKALPEITLTNDAPEISLTLTEYFTDPDGHALTFSAAVSDETVIRASVTTDVLRVERVGRGNAVVRVTATDPHGLSASGNAEVRLIVTEELLNDEFETLDDGWERNDGAVAEIVDGRLRLASNDPDSLAMVRHAVDRSTDWTVTMNLEYATNNAWPGLIIETGGTPEAFVVLFGANFRRLTDGSAGPSSPTNLVIAAYTGAGWQTRQNWLGWFEQIAGTGTPMNVGLGMDAVSLKVLVDDAVIHELPELAALEIKGVTLSVWPPRDVQSFDGSEQIYFDWIRVTGIPAGASPAEASVAALSLFPNPSSVRIIR